MNYDDVHRQQQAYLQHKAPSSIPLRKPEHPAAATLRSMAEAFTRLADACQRLAAGDPYRRRTPSGTDCGLSVELPWEDAQFLANWLKALREQHGPTCWVCMGCWQLQTEPPTTWLATNLAELAAPLCEACRDHARPDPEHYADEQEERNPEEHHVEYSREEELERREALDRWAERNDEEGRE